MSDTLNKVILIGEQEQIVPLTAEEIARINESIKETQAQKATVQAAADKATADKAAVQAKLTALGLTADDLAALGL